MNNIYLYDGSFDNLITLILHLIKINNKPDIIISEKEYVPNLLEEPIFINIVKEKEKLNYFNNIFSNRIKSTIYYIYLSCNDNKELVMYYFIKNALKYKDKIFYYRNLNCVNKTINMVHYVTSETHKLKGFLRFKKMKNNFYYAKIKPNNNIIGLLANHFKKRLSNESFVIKDDGRNIYVLYDKKNITFLEEKDIINMNLKIDEEEEYIENLWKTFFNTIGIKERENLKCQQNFMPKRYWQYMIEMEDKL